MAALRWILLLAGLLFLAALAAWEMRRPRQGSGDAAQRSERNEPALGSLGGEAPPARAAASGGEDGRSRTVLPPRVDLPPFDVPDAPDAPDAPDETPQSAGTSAAAAPVQGLEPGAAPESALAAQPEAQPGVQPGAQPGGGPTAGLPPAMPAAAAALVVDWPPEAQRHIISLRLVPSVGERLSGRAVRQALAACGFVHGPLAIFHQPAADGRALLSAANLSHPGTFDPLTMDFQRFAGVSLFAVTPGPLPPAATLSQLLETARELTERLQVRLQDEQGLPLDAARLEALKRTVQQLPAHTMRAEPAA